MIDAHRLEELVNALYDQGELMVRVEKIDDDTFRLDKSGTVRPQLNTRGPFDDGDRLIASGFFALCGLDPVEDTGEVFWSAVARVCEDELDLFEVIYDLQDYAGADGISDHLYDLVRARDPRLSALPELGPQEDDR